MRKIAYLRVSTAEQRPDRQIDGLQHLCDELHIEKLSAVAKTRPVYNDVIKNLKSGDIFVIWDLDRAFRSTIDALKELDALQKRNIAIHIANLNIDTSSPHGLLIYTIISALAEFERRLLSQRTKEGLAAARRRGRRIGRPPKLTNNQLLRAAHRIKHKGKTVQAVAQSYDVAAWTLVRSFKRNGIQWR
jgi:DNA invertase Pin-like site-specific DNA recombinase